MMGRYTKNTNCSIYTKDFYNQRKMQELPAITMDFWTSKYKWPSMNIKTTNSADFVGHKDH